MTLDAVVFDWAGTLVDFGSLAPIRAFTAAFERAGVPVTTVEARAPMGSAKRDHIAAVLAMPAVAARWEAAHGAPPTTADGDRIYAAFLPLNEGLAADGGVPIPGAVEAVAFLRVAGIPIGSTTGYTRSIMARLLPAAEAHGLSLDCVVTADDVQSGRPAPDGVLKNLKTFGIEPSRAVVKVDDTPVGILEGKNAGCRTVGVALSGNLAGLCEDDLADLSPAAIADLRASATAALTEAGADHVIDTVRDLPPLLGAV
ncbi:MAG: phosphonoacetaldehyde hydrolase [Pseudomonadota bacterium]